MENEKMTNLEQFAREMKEISDRYALIKNSMILIPITVRSISIRR